MHWPFALLMGNGKFAGALRVGKSKRSNTVAPRCMSYVVKRRFSADRKAERIVATTRKTGEKKKKTAGTNNNGKKCDALYVRFCRVNKIMILYKTKHKKKEYYNNNNNNNTQRKPERMK